MKRPGAERLGKGDSRHKGPQVGPGVPEGPERWCEGRGVGGVPKRVAKAGGAGQSCRASKIRVWTVDFLLDARGRRWRIFSRGVTFLTHTSRSPSVLHGEWIIGRPEWRWNKLGDGVGRDLRAGGKWADLGCLGGRVDRTR